MYIFKVKKTSHSLKELHSLEVNAQPGDPKLVEFEPLHRPYPDDAPDYYSLFKQIAYWRKFNALHQWFVTHVQLGIDNCGTYELNRDALFECLETLEATHNLKDSNKMPPTQGFFWGSTEVDSAYWNNVKNSIKTISGLIDYTDWDNERLFYQSSW
jgi:hypothetical protein